MPEPVLQRITELPEGIEPLGPEVIPVVQGGNTVKIRADLIAPVRSVNGEIGDVVVPFEDAVDAEALERIAADVLLQAAIDFEADARADDDTTEINARIAGDAAVQATVTTETNRAVAAEAGLLATHNAHLSDATDAHDASAVSFSPAGALVSTDVQAALAELDSAKAPLSTLGEVVQDLIAATLQQGGNIGLVYDDGLGTLTVSVTGLTSANISNFTEAAQDAVGAALAATATLSLAYNDGANSIAGTVLDSPTVAGVTPSQLRDRATHTGTQTASTISDLTEVTQDTVGTMVLAGTNASVSYNDGAGTLTIGVTGLTSAQISDFVEAAQDAVGVTLTDTSTLDLTYNDGLGTISGAVLDSPLLGGQAGSFYLARTNHTGTQAQSTVDDLVADLSDIVTNISGLETDLAAETARATTAEDLKLAKTSNLSDVVSPSTALANVGGIGTAGTGLTKSGTTVNVGAGTGITVNADDVALAASVQTDINSRALDAEVIHNFGAETGAGAKTWTGLSHFTASAQFRGDPWTDVNDFPGVDPTGVADSTVGLQTAIDYAIGAGPLASRGTPAAIAVARYRLRFRGTYKTTAPLHFRSVRSLVVDFGNSLFQPAGTFDAVFDFNGCTWSEFYNAAFSNGTGTQDKVVHYQWDSTLSANSSSGCTFRNFVVYQNITHRIGFAIGVNNADQVDGSSYHNIILHGAWTGTVNQYGAVTSGNTLTYQYGIKIGNGGYGNNIDHVFFNCNPNAYARGYYGDAANYAVYGSQIGVNGVDFYISPSVYTTIQSVRSEGSQRLISTTGGGGSFVGTLSDIQFVGDAAHADGIILSWALSGDLTIRGLSMINIRGGVTASMAFVGYAGLTVVIDGVVMPTPWATAFATAYNVKLVPLAFTQYDPVTTVPSSHTTGLWRSGSSYVSDLTLVQKGNENLYGDLNQSSLGIPTGVSLNYVGGVGATTRGYRVSAVNSRGETAASAEVTVANTVNPLSGSEFVIIGWTPVVGAVSYRIYGRTPGSELLIGEVFTPDIGFYDFGTITPSGALPVGMSPVTAFVEKAVATDDVEVSTIGKGYIDKSPDGTRWRITIDDTGAVVTTAI